MDPLFMTLTDLTRAMLVIGLGVLAGAVVSLAWGALSDFHRRGRARVAAYEQATAQRRQVRPLA